MYSRDGTLFTPTEAAVLTRLTLKAVNNAIDKAMVPTASASRDSGRLLDARGLLALMLEQRLSSHLVPELRRRLFAALPRSPRCVLSLEGEIVSVKVDLREPRRDLALRLRTLRRARSLAVSDREILGGDPVFRGTRVPVHLIAMLLEQGDTEGQILEAYPRLTKEMIRLAPEYAQAYPVRGRPRRESSQDGTPVRRIRVPLAGLKAS